MARKVIIDCDPGIDDAIVLCMALFDPRLEIVAVTAAEGNVSAHQASRNVQTIIEQLDPPRLPRVGVAGEIEDAPATDSSSLHGEDGLGNAGFRTSELHHQHPSDKIICDEVRAAEDEVTILCLGPLTNVARALKRDPELCTMISQVVIAGGSIGVGGNVTPAAEFNMYFDPVSARTVFRSAMTKTLVPLDVAREVALTFDVMEELPAEATRVGSFLRKLMPFAFRAHHQVLGQEGFRLPAVVALLSIVQPELFHTEEMAGDVETRGILTKGATVFDRRIKTLWRPNMEVVTELDAVAATDCVVRGLSTAGTKA
ncbi:MAG: nucleoside hydrolase [Planctomycetes bacterium]|nr:nucleoside hydrolase [Planctomycetota bacterium]